MLKISRPLMVFAWYGRAAARGRVALGKAGASLGTLAQLGSEDTNRRRSYPQSVPNQRDATSFQLARRAGATVPAVPCIVARPATSLIQFT